MVPNSLSDPQGHLGTLHVRLLVANCADERRQTERKIDRLTDRGPQGWCWWCLNAGQIQISQTNLGENHV